MAPSTSISPNCRARLRSGTAVERYLLLRPMFLPLAQAWPPWLLLLPTEQPLVPIPCLGAWERHNWMVWGHRRGDHHLWRFGCNEPSFSLPATAIGGAEGNHRLFNLE